MTILIAEDDPITLEALATCIEREGFATLRAPDGRAALEMWRLHQPDLLCLDIMMPGLDGYSLCRRVRESDREVPILFLSAKNQEIDIVAGLDLGADDFIRKPFTRHEVLARIRAALRRRIGTAPGSFSVGPLVIHPSRQCALRGGTSIELTPREISILRLLHQHRGEAVSRDAFFDTCWGSDYFPDSRTLDQHICVLRRKIEANPSDPDLILTVRSIGYRLGMSA
ncbi:DNA-binding response OmpR family regulator [Haloferula luteola]|uniref:DNA-binding response OmpR family regulator n=1 Tax=Haloferula luteola TaxID=595692 RepID=A0A840V2D3_9BACT|nr:response regulator transcription factor [Haloferula luteola]MBB5351206.1 DNA-binding response OmpR family regulator [Haloferula luteola]